MQRYHQLSDFKASPRGLRWDPLALTNRIVHIYPIIAC